MSSNPPARAPPSSESCPELCNLNAAEPDLRTPLLRTPCRARSYLAAVRTDDSRRASCLGIDAECDPASTPTDAAGTTQDPQPLSCISFTLENCGSVARDHLASERTFLAYVRTSLAIASAGVALAQLLSLSGPSKQQMIPTDLNPMATYARPLAVSSIIMALFVLLLGVSRYFCIQAALTQGVFPVARLGIGALALGLAVLVTVLFGLLGAENSTMG